MSLQAPDWGSLPADVLYKIFQSIRIEAKAMREVCRTWKVSLDSVSSKLTVVGGHLQLGFAARFTSLRALDLRRYPPVNITQLRALQGLPLINLVLNLTHEDLTETAARTLKAMSLTKLDLELVEGGKHMPHQVSTVWLERLEGLPLVRLHACWVDFEEPGLFPLKGMPLVDLCLLGGFRKGHKNINFSLEPLRDMSLTALRFFTNKSMVIWDDGDLAVLREKPLTVLDLGNNRFTDVGMQNLRGMALTELDFSTVVEGNLVTDAGLGVLRGMPLRALGLGGFKDISSFGLRVLEGMPLVSLALANTKVGDSGLAYLRFSPLTSLDLSGCSRIRGTGFTVLEDLPLRFLSVENCSRLIPLTLARLYIEAVMLGHTG